MKLWKLTQTENSGFDTYDSVIVAASTADEARLMCPDEYAELCDGTWFKSYLLHADLRRPIDGWATRPGECHCRVSGRSRSGNRSGHNPSQLQRRLNLRLALTQEWRLLVWLQTGAQTCRCN